MGKRTRKERQTDLTRDQAIYVDRYRKIHSDPKFQEDLETYKSLLEKEKSAACDKIRLEGELEILRAFDEPSAISANPSLKPLWDDWRESFRKHADAKQEREAIEKEITQRYGILLPGLRPHGILADLSLQHHNALVADMPWVFDDQLPVQPIPLKPSKYESGDVASTILLGGKYLPLVVNMEHKPDAIRDNFAEWIREEGRLVRNQKKRSGQKIPRRWLDTDARRAEARKLFAEGKTKKEIAAKMFPDEWKDPADRKRLVQRIRYYLESSKG